jgi:S1-C subfamily serine protease
VEAEVERVVVEVPSILHRTLWLASMITLTSALLGALALVWVLDDSTVTQQVATPPSFDEGSNLTFDGEAIDIQGVLGRVQPSVVTLRTGQETVRGVFEGAGSGVVISDDGLILTNAHVISGADQIEVFFFDGTSALAELVGSFPDDDIALIQTLDVTGTTPAVLGTAESLRVGDEVVAIGNALNLGSTPSVTRGIVSAKGRSIEAGIISLSELIQTDAAINPGNSGGPLVNAAGEVVGINTAIIDNAQNVGFAISIDVVKPLVEQLVAGQGDITSDTAFLGVTTQTLADLSPDLLAESGVDTPTGAFVVDVVPGAAASDAGIKAGDVIVGIGGETVDASEDVGRIVRGASPGDALTIDIERNGQRQSVDATLGARGN